MKPTFGSTWQESPPTCVHDCGAWAAAAFAEARKIVDNKIEGPAWTILSSWARLTPAGACKLMPAITTRSGRTGHWIKIRRSPVRFSRPEALNRTLSLVDFITITFESRFSVHTGVASARHWLDSSAGCGTSRAIGRHNRLRSPSHPDRAPVKWVAITFTCSFFHCYH